jgi:hypothetical protein
LVKFLPRRTYENYLLDPDGIAAVLNEAMEAGERPSAAVVAEWLQEETGPEEDWRTVVNAPKLLREFFLKHARIEYNKIVHSAALTTWLLANKPEFLTELLEYVSSLVAHPHRPTGA